MNTNEEQFNITIADLRQTATHVRTVPTIQQLKASNQKKRASEAMAQADAERKRIQAITDEALAKEIAENMPLSEVLKAYRERIMKDYPDATFFFMGMEKSRNQKPGDPDHDDCCMYGTTDIKKTSLLLARLMCKYKEPHEIVSMALQTFYHSGRATQAEKLISSLKKTLRFIERMNDPIVRRNLLEAEIKRLEKQGDKDMIKERIKEFEDIRKQIEHNKQMRERQLEALARGRETQRQNREKAKRRKQNQPQPNFAKMAKDARKKKAQEKAERKKAKSGCAAGNDANVKSCSQMLMR